MMTDARNVMTGRSPVARPARERIEAVALPARYEPIGALWALAICTWFGLFAGVLELGFTLAQKPLIDPSPGFFRMNRHIVWSIPAVNLALFAFCGVLVAIASRVRPRLGVRGLVATPVLLAVLTLLLSLRWLHILACLILACAIAFRLSRRIARNLAVFRRIVLWSAPPLALAVTGLLGFSLGGHLVRVRREIAAPLSAPAAKLGAPNVVLVVLDTVRADHLSLHGYGRDTSPNLARLARSGVSFEQARSTAPWTLPSHASMMTGRWPHELSTTINSPLDGTYKTLAEHLAENGYSTAGFVANNAYAGAETGLSRGFALYEDHGLSIEDILWNSAFGQRVILLGLHPPEPRTGASSIDYHRKAAAWVVDDALAWVSKVNRRPFFAFLNLYDAHDPYLPPEESDCCHFGVKPESAADLVTLYRWFVLDKKRVTERERRLIGDAYDDCIAYVDRQLGRFVDGLDRAGRLENTLVIVTADHGEHLGEHELYGHASSLYDAEIHVPLLVLLPGGAHAGQSIAAPVSLRDLAATISDVIGIGGSPFPGRSLARFWAPGESTDPRSEPSLSEVDGPVNCTPNQGRSPVFGGPLHAIAERGEVYIRDSSGREQLFDVRTDPKQLSNLAALPKSAPSIERFRAHFARLIPDERGHGGAAKEDLTLR
jgi:arylsulfatase A-like enzyme